MAASSILPRLVVADARGNIYDHPDLLMMVRRGNEFAIPRPNELMPLPDESELFLLPKRRPLGLNPDTGEMVSLFEDGELAVAAFAAPAHTFNGLAAYKSEKDAPTLPLFAYGAVGFDNDRFYVAAKKTDESKRQVFAGVKYETIKKRAKALVEKYPQNRLIQHLMEKCALTYACPAARNLALGRYEAPLPTSKVCNARCVGCISQQESGSKICATPQNRLQFTPTALELVEVMEHHSSQEKKEPIFSFGQGCEGEPLTEAPLLEEAIKLFRSKGGRGTINVNTNASIPMAVERLAKVGLSSIRVSINSLRPTTYERYYRPNGYTLDDVCQSIKVAKEHKLFVSLNLLFFPGITDTELEFEALLALVEREKIDLIQMRNLNIDPELFLNLLSGLEFGPCMGLNNFCKRLKKFVPDLSFGYFNPYVG
ncbi:radical SAM protein [Desulfovibrio litoralis]|uniref:Radical SAM superfamily protein n=1 Tax=Desulfovibrio litoralis DSM 11393 TaxID=1121455 RepID=A0A1M7T6P9_9BACT|nr:radical SAM protein [Desulfovibrio litoralis]SHN66374.1 Radical SAM superfamily protein [Desulfovibrio litoralis DSM 11393]